MEPWKLDPLARPHSPHLPCRLVSAGVEPQTRSALHPFCNLIGQSSVPASKRLLSSITFPVFHIPRCPAASGPGSRCQPASHNAAVLSGGMEHSRCFTDVSPDEPILCLIFLSIDILVCSLFTAGEGGPRPRVDKKKKKNRLDSEKLESIHLHPDY